MNLMFTIWWTISNVLNLNIITPALLILVCYSWERVKLQLKLQESGSVIIRKRQILLTNSQFLLTMSGSHMLWRRYLYRDSFIFYSLQVVCSDWIPMLSPRWGNGIAFCLIPLTSHLRGALVHSGPIHIFTFLFDNAFFSLCCGPTSILR